MCLMSCWVILGLAFEKSKILSVFIWEEQISEAMHSDGFLNTVSDLIPERSTHLSNFLSLWPFSARWRNFFAGTIMELLPSPTAIENSSCAVMTRISLIIGWIQHVLHDLFLFNVDALIKFRSKSSDRYPSATALELIPVISLTRPCATHRCSTVSTWMFESSGKILRYKKHGLR